MRGRRGELFERVSRISICMGEQNGKGGDLVVSEDFAHAAEKLEFAAVLDLVAGFAGGDRSKERDPRVPARRIPPRRPSGSRKKPSSS